jgi:hypothetical protein
VGIAIEVCAHQALCVAGAPLTWPAHLSQLLEPRFLSKRVLRSLLLITTRRCVGLRRALFSGSRPVAIVVGGCLVLAEVGQVHVWVFVVPARAQLSPKPPSHSPEVDADNPGADDRGTEDAGPESVSFLEVVLHPTRPHSSQSEAIAPATADCHLSVLQLCSMDSSESISRIQPSEVIVVKILFWCEISAHRAEVRVHLFGMTWRALSSRAKATGPSR